MVDASEYKKGRSRAKVLHFGLSRPDLQRAKMRLYAVIEATRGTARLHDRRSGYVADRDYTAGHTVSPVYPEWFAGWATTSRTLLRRFG